MDPELNKTRQSYDQNASQIADGFWSTELPQFWDAFCQMLPAGAKVVDIGCGPGRDTAQFIQRGFWAVGLDFSQGMLKEALRRTQAPFLQGDMRFLPFSPATFAGAWVCASLLHLPREQAPATLAGIWRMLKPGGLLFLALKEGQGAGWDTRKGERFFTYYQEDDLRVMLVSAGYEIVRLIKYPGETSPWLNLFARKLPH